MVSVTCERNRDVGPRVGQQVKTVNTSRVSPAVVRVVQEFYERQEGMFA